MIGKYRLTKNDEKLITFLLSQGQATAAQLGRRFFASMPAFYNRISQLERAGWVEAQPITECANATSSGVVGMMSALKLKRNQVTGMMVYRVARDLRKAVPFGEDTICEPRLMKHQVLLGEVREKVEVCLRGREYVVLNDPQIEAEGATKFYGNSLVPDLVFRGSVFSLAVELERRNTTESDLMMRFAKYRDSQYKKVIYFCESEAIYRRVMKLAAFYRKIAFGFIFGDGTITFERNTMSLSDYLALGVV